MTGIDRVQAAYERWARSQDAWAVARLGNGLVWLDPQAWRGLSMDVPLDLRALLRPDRERWRRQVESALRRAGTRADPEAETYINVGHSNLERMGQIRAKQRVALIHDVIPLDMPRWQTPQSVQRFRTQINAVKEHATLVYAPAEATARTIAKHLKDRHPVFAIHLGIDVPAAPPMPHPRPYILCLGTIEPRKNHRLLLDVWQDFDDGPDLVLIGRRGWANATLFDTLDRHPLRGSRLHELGALDDAETARWMTGAAALAFPSRAEGFGLPLLEALGAGIPVLASDLPVFRELAGSDAVYLSPNRPEEWRIAVKKFTQEQEISAKRHQKNVPDWDEHFGRLKKLMQATLTRQDTANEGTPP